LQEKYSCVLKELHEKENSIEQLAQLKDEGILQILLLNQELNDCKNENLSLKRSLESAEKKKSDQIVLIQQLSEAIQTMETTLTIAEKREIETKDLLNSLTEIIEQRKVEYTRLEKNFSKLKEENGVLVFQLNEKQNELQLFHSSLNELLAGNASFAASKFVSPGKPATQSQNHNHAAAVSPEQQPDKENYGNNSKAIPRTTVQQHPINDENTILQENISVKVFSKNFHSFPHPPRSHPNQNTVTTYSPPDKMLEIIYTKQDEYVERLMELSLAMHQSLSIIFSSFSLLFKENNPEFHEFKEKLINFSVLHAKLHELVVYPPWAKDDEPKVELTPVHLLSVVPSQASLTVYSGMMGQEMNVKAQLFHSEEEEEPPNFSGSNDENSHPRPASIPVKNYSDSSTESKENVNKYAQWTSRPLPPPSSREEGYDSQIIIRGGSQTKKNLISASYNKNKEKNFPVPSSSASSSSSKKVQIPTSGAVSSVENNKNSSEMTSLEKKLFQNQPFHVLSEKMHQETGGFKQEHDSNFNIRSINEIIEEINNKQLHSTNTNSNIDYQNNNNEVDDLIAHLENKSQHEHNSNTMESADELVNRIDSYMKQFDSQKHRSFIQERKESHSTSVQLLRAEEIESFDMVRTSYEEKEEEKSVVISPQKQLFLDDSIASDFWNISTDEEHSSFDIDSPVYQS
jgi:predicted patatin/cPLA2 family phospholipase